MDYVILKNPKSVNYLTADRKENYYIVYDFESGVNTQLTLNGHTITRDQAEQYQIRYYSPEVRDFQPEFFKADYSDSLMVFSAVCLFSFTVLIFGK